MGEVLAFHPFIRVVDFGKNLLSGNDFGKEKYSRKVKTYEK